jgi:GNAT superfamily N-acetyltransferase
MKFDWHKNELTSETKITENYKTTQNVRRFLKKHFGEDFHFSREMMAWMKSNAGKTLGEAVTEWSNSFKNVTIRPFAETDGIEELTLLLNRAYKALADMNLHFVASHQNAERTRKRVSEGKCFVALKSGVIIGTICYYPPENTHGTPWYDLPNVAHFGQFGVEPELQKSGIGDALLKIVEEEAFKNGVEELALDTAEPAIHLIEFYKKRGYRFIEYTQWDEVNYRSVIMSKNFKRSYNAKNNG